MTRPIQIDDFARIRLVSDPQISPDGKQIVFVVRRADTEKNKYFTDLWLVPAEGGEPRRFTAGDCNDSNPRWSPDGKRIAFLSDREKPKAQVYVIAADGGEAVPLTHIETEGAIQGLRWSPDGKQLAFLFRATPEGYRKEQVEERGKKEMPSPPRLHQRLFYRLDGFGYFDESFWQVWVADAATGDTREITSGAFMCGPPTWSPDSGRLAFLSDRRDDWDLPPAHADIWTVPAAGGELTRIHSPAGEKSDLAWSPDGRSFAYVSRPNAEEQWGTQNERLYLLPAEGGDTPRDLTGDSDLTVGHLTLSDVHDVGSEVVWSHDGERIFFAVSTFGDCRLYYVRTAGARQLVAITPQGAEMGGFSLSADESQLVVTLASLTAPHELFKGKAHNRADARDDWKQLTSLNREWLSEVQVAPPQPVSIPNGEGGEVHGWLLRPPGSKSGERNPLVLYVHGGPHMQYGNTFFHELQFLAAQGYVVLYTNPRGSKGYGEAHTSAIKGDWGGADFRDVMAGADYAAALPEVDPARMAIMGGSYGGFMTAWAVGHTDRFHCAITDRLVANLHSMSGTSDFPWEHGTYFKGNAWDDPADLWRHSPLAYAGNIRTPLLIIHSDGDLRCDVGQAEELFAALRLQRKEVEFVRYPAETSHGLSRGGPPNLRIDRMQRNLAWLDRWLKG